MRFIANILDMSIPPRWVLDLGSYDVNGSPRGLFGPEVEYIGIELRPGPGVDIVADAATWRPASPVDWVICSSLLEHTPLAAEILDNAARMLAPGGLLVLTVPSIGWPPHGNDGGPVGREYYHGVTRIELHRWLTRSFAPFCILDSGDGQLFALAVPKERGDDHE